VLELRKAEASDLPFLIALRRGTMWSHFENAGVPIDQAFQLEPVLYRYDCAHVVTSEGRGIGLLKVCRDEDPWELIQIQLAASHSGYVMRHQHSRRKV
jgi:hypothetical protein